MKLFGMVFSVIVGFGIVVYFWARVPEHIVLAKAEQQYEMAVRSGTSTDACVAAGLVKAAALQAGNEEKFKEYGGYQADLCPHLNPYLGVR